MLININILFYFILANNSSHIGDINIAFYFSIYIVVSGRDKNKGIDIDDLFYVLSPIFFDKYVLSPLVK